MITKIIESDGFTYVLDTDGLARLLGAAVAFGWEPVELAPLRQAKEQIDLPDDVATNCCDDKSQSKVDLIGALERLLATLVAGPLDRDEELADGIETLCCKYRTKLQETRLLAIEPFDNDDGGELVEIMLNTLNGGNESIRQ